MTFSDGMRTPNWLAVGPISGGERGRAVFLEAGWIVDSPPLNPPRDPASHPDDGLRCGDTRQVPPTPASTEQQMPP